MQLRDYELEFTILGLAVYKKEFAQNGEEIVTQPPAELLKYSLLGKCVKNSSEDSHYGNSFSIYKGNQRSTIVTVWTVPELKKLFEMEIGNAHVMSFHNNYLLIQSFGFKLELINIENSEKLYELKLFSSLNIAATDGIHVNILLQSGLTLYQIAGVTMSKTLKVYELLSGRLKFETQVPIHTISTSTDHSALQVVLDYNKVIIGYQNFILMYPMNSGNFCEIRKRLTQIKGKLSCTIEILPIFKHIILTEKKLFIVNEESCSIVHFDMPSASFTVLVLDGCKQVI